MKYIHIISYNEFPGGLIARLDSSMRMTADQAKKFALIFRQCAKCGRKLKDADSVERGIGPVCRKYFGF